MINLKTYLSLAALAVFLFLLFGYIDVLQNDIKTLETRINTANELFAKYEEQYKKSVTATEEKHNALLDSEKRIEELEKLLEMDACSNVRINDAVNKRLRERVNSIRKPAASAGKSNS